MVIVEGALVVVEPVLHHRIVFRVLVAAHVQEGVLDVQRTVIIVVVKDVLEDVKVA